ncbi:Hypothetical protein R9X50_00090200 [Acrodontium crateriforme]|uniref:Nascent polypeptide-associated complex subunit alpha-like UBA domain-containing protein n=1 Tax=Acrodontium crateriforme TaxID=150365 RepID=A0AAQ3LZ11_9PEZI|nr:Hypothetical protein R9X50_00090200 [Acrodontium crateriforme]
MAEPQPSNVHEGADAPDVIPATAEDRKAAKAMSSLDATDESSASKKEVDLKALNNAMRNLGAGGDDKAKKMASAKKEEAKKPLVKVDPADVTLLAQQLDMNKTKATELLRSHDADVKKAMISWVTSPV